MANILYHSLQPGLEDAYLNGGAGFVSMGGPAMPGPHEDGGMIYSNSELNDPEYSTDDFRMFSFKVARCSKRYVHDWRSCPFAHPTENARRRDPRAVRYLPVPCPDYKRGICMRGDTCPYSHGVYECWLHPAKYRTQLCKEGPQCRRPVCFFAHTVGDLRQPTHLWNGSNGDGVQAPGSAAANLINMQQQPAINADVIKSSPSLNNNNNNMMDMQAQRTDSDAANIMQVAAEEAFNNMQEQTVPIHSGSGFPAQSSVSPPLSPLGASASAAGGGAGFNNGMSESVQKAGEDATPRTPSHQNGDPFAANTTDCVVNAANSITGTGSGQEDSSVAASDIISQQSSEDITITANASNVAVAAAASAAASRISLDNNMQLRAANQAARTGAPSWSQGLAASASAAVALAGVPVNEQPMLPNHGPRMSNAVARKLGLAPVKPPTAPSPATATANPVSEPVHVRGNGNGNGNTTPGRHSIDGALPIQQQHQQYQQQQPQRASFDEVRLSQAALASFGNGNCNNGMPFPSANMNSQFGNGNGGYSSSYPGSADALGIHPALLNLVAANMVNGVNVNGNNAALHQFHQQQQQQQLFGYGNGDPHNGFAHGNNNMGGMNGMNGHMGVVDDSGVASLLGHMSQWGLSESSGDSIRGEGSVHSSKNSMSFPHRGSSDGMLGATGLPQQGPSSNTNNNHSGGGSGVEQGSTASYLMSLDLGGAESNNNRSISSEC